VILLLNGASSSGKSALARELARGDRFQNLARAQLPGIHEFRDFYDLEVDTTARGPHDLADSIFEFVTTQPEPAGMARLHSKLFPQEPVRGSTVHCS